MKPLSAITNVLENFGVGLVHDGEVNSGRTRDCFLPYSLGAMWTGAIALAFDSPSSLIWAAQNLHFSDTNTIDAIICSASAACLYKSCTIVKDIYSSGTELRETPKAFNSAGKSLEIEIIVPNGEIVYKTSQFELDNPDYFAAKKHKQPTKTVLPKNALVLN